RTSRRRDEMRLSRSLSGCDAPGAISVAPLPFGLLAEREQLHPESVAQQVVHLPAQGLGQQEARVTQEQSRPAGEVLRQLPCTPQQLVGREDLGDEAQLERLLGVERLAGQEEVAAPVHAQE